MVREKLDIEAHRELVKMSELSDEKQEKTRVLVMDKKFRRKIGIGQELDLTKMVEDEGVLEFVDAPEDVPGGQTVIRGPTISGGDLSSAIIRDFGAFSTSGGVFISDGFYFLYPDTQVKKVLSEDLTDLQMWINTYFDCDDFAQVVSGLMNDKLKGVPFGVLWFRGPGFYHAVNCYYSRDQKKMKLVEPQNDAIYDFNKTNWVPVLAMI